MTGQAAGTGGLKVGGTVSKARLTGAWQYGFAVLSIVLALIGLTLPTIANVCSVLPDLDVAWVDSADENPKDDTEWKLHTRVKDGELRRSYIQAQIPSWADTVILHMTAKSDHPKPADTTAEVRIVSESWKPSEIAWSNAPTPGISVGTLYGTGSVDVTAAVTNGLLNVALVLSDEASETERHIDWPSGYVEVRYDCCNVYEINFVSAVYDSNTNETAFTYQAISHDDPEISHFVLEIEIGSCAFDAWLRGGSWVNPDPTTGSIGLKIDGNDGFHTFYLRGDWEEYIASGEATVKAGSTMVCDSRPTLLPDGCPSTNPEIAITKESNHPAGQVGKTIVYTYTITNPGDVPLSPVSLSDDLLGTITGPASGDTNSNGDLDVTETWIYEKSYAIDWDDRNSYLDGSYYITNIATVTGTAPDTSVVSAIADATIRICTVDISVEKTAPVEATAGGQITYTIVVTNNGPMDKAISVELTDILPVGLLDATYVITAGGSGSGVWTGSLDLGDMVYPSSITIEITATVGPSAPASLENMACISNDVWDPDTSDNCSSTTTTVTPIADLGIEKTCHDLVAGEQGALAYTITVTNHGPSTATGVS